MILDNSSFMAKDRCQQRRPHPVQLLYTTAGLCSERAARIQWCRPKNKTSVSALLSMMVGWSWPRSCVSLGLHRLACAAASGLAFLFDSGLDLHIYSWSLALRWKSKQRSERPNKQPSQSQTATPSSSSCPGCSPQPPLYHSVVLNGPPSCCSGL